MTNLLRILLFMTLLMVVFTIEILPQTPQQRNALLRIAEEARQRSIIEKSHAESLAVEMNIPIRKTLDDGSFVELMRFENGIPMYYTTHNLGSARTISTNNLWDGGSSNLNLSGWTEILAIFDAGRVRLSHREFDDRVTQEDDYPDISLHATHVAGTMIASGIDERARGMAPEAVLHAYHWGNDAANMAEEASQGLRVSNHSYGYNRGWVLNFFGDGRWAWFGDPDISQTEDYRFGFYTNEAQLWDEIAHQAPQYLITKSAGNERGNGPTSQPIEHWVLERNWLGVRQWTLSDQVRDIDGGNDGYVTIADMATAKNILTVGAINEIPNGYTSPEDVQLGFFSAFGPTDDGRIKPDIVAKGVNVFSVDTTADNTYYQDSGTSMAAPAVSGSIGLIHQRYRQLYGMEAPLASTIKGLVIHSADPATHSPGPDYRHGWGVMNTERAANIMTMDEGEGGDFNIRELTLSQGEVIEFNVISQGNEPLRATMVWTDPPGEPVEPQLNPTDLMLVNDLDLRIIDPDQTSYLPYILDPHNPHSPATTGDNFRDNVEQIHINEPDPGLYTIRVNHKGTLTGGSQDFSLIITGISSDLPTIVIDEILFDSDSYQPNETATLSVTLADALEGAVVSYRVGGGSVQYSNEIGNGMYEANFTTPSSAGSYNISITAQKDGYAEATGSIELVVTDPLAGHDFAITHLSLDRNNIGLNDAVSVLARVDNVGTVSQTDVPVVLRLIDPNGNTVDSYEQYVSLDPGGHESISRTLWSGDGPEGNYIVEARSLLETDSDPSNDYQRRSIYVGDSPAFAQYKQDDVVILPVGENYTYRDYTLRVERVWTTPDAMDLTVMRGSMQEQTLAYKDDLTFFDNGELIVEYVYYESYNDEAWANVYLPSSDITVTPHRLVIDAGSDGVYEYETPFPRLPNISDIYGEDKDMVSSWLSTRNYSNGNFDLQANVPLDAQRTTYSFWPLINGYLQYLELVVHEPHNVRAISLSPESGTERNIGEEIAIEGVFKNEGGYDEFEISMRMDIEGPGDYSTTMHQTIDLERGEQNSVTFTWNTLGLLEGEYVITMEAIVHDDPYDNNSISSTIELIAPPAEPLITVSETSLNFGTIQVGGHSSPQSYNITGIDLIDDVSISAPSGFEISLSSESDYQNNLSITPEDGNVNSTVYVRFSPTDVKDYSGKISNSSPGATTEEVSVEGTGGDDAIADIRPISSSTTYFRGTPFWIEVEVGNPEEVSNLYGISFKLQSDTDLGTYVDGSAEEGDFLGSPVLFFSQKVNNRTVDIGVTKTSGGGESGSGIVALAQYTTPSDLSDELDVTFSLTDIEGVDPDGNTIPFDPSSLTITITTGVAVWPGDTNNDGIVNSADILPIGIFYGQSFGEENNPGIQWKEYIRTPWPQDGDNPARVYADANGSGVIDAADVLAIGVNYNEVQPSEALLAKGLYKIDKGTVEGRLVPSTSLENRSMLLEIDMESNSPVFGVSFKAVFRVNDEIFDGIEFGDAITSDGVLGEVLLFTQVVDEEGYVDIGLTRTEGEGYRGGGRLLSIPYTLSEELRISDNLEITITDVVANDESGERLHIEGMSFTAQYSDIAGNDVLPQEYVLHQNYPNPFNPTTTITFSVPKESHVWIEVYDILGRQMATLIDDRLDIGTHQVEWDANISLGRAVGSGVYIYRMTAESADGSDTYSTIKRMLFLK